MDAWRDVEAARLNALDVLRQAEDAVRVCACEVRLDHQMRGLLGIGPRQAFREISVGYERVEVAYADARGIVRGGGGHVGTRCEAGVADADAGPLKDLRGYRPP